MALQDVGDRVFIDLNPQLLQFAFDLAVAPIFVLQSQVDHQTLDVSRRARSSSFLGLGPFSFDQLAIPTNHRVRFEEPQCITQLRNGSVGDGF